MIKKALNFATDKHQGQVRKYTNEPYITHPIAVSALVATVTNDHEVIAAALLHDTVEDTEATIGEITTLFGGRVARMVFDLTNVSRIYNGNRVVRKALDREHISKGTQESHTIKLADMIDNSQSIIKYDPNFAKIYMAEKNLLLAVLQGNSDLWLQAHRIVTKYFE